MAYRHPHHQGVPGTTAYYTLPNVGGFYAPVPRQDHDSDMDDEDAQQQQQRTVLGQQGVVVPPPLPQPQAMYGQPPLAFAQQPYLVPSGHTPGMMMGAAAVPGLLPSRMFNGWQGIPEEKKGKGEKEKEKENEKGKKGDKSDKTSKSDNKEKSKKTANQSSWQQLTGSLRKRSQSQSQSQSQSRRRHNGSSSSSSDTDVAYDYDNCDTPVRRRSDLPHEQVTYSEDAMVEVTIQPHGSARIIVHLDDGEYGNDDDESGEDCAENKTVSFIVSDRCLRTAAKEWPHQCHAGTRTCDIHVSCDEAVIGMYWMLHVLHQAGHTTAAAAASNTQAGLVAQQRDRQFQQQVALQQFLQEKRRGGGGRDDSASASASTCFIYDYYHGCVGTRAVPVELPPRVLAFTVMLAVQFGVLQPWQPGEEAPLQLSGPPPAYPVQGQGQGQTHQESQPQPPPTTSPAPAGTAFRAAADQWLRSITANRCNAASGRLNHVTVPSGDLVFVLYAARTLGCAALLRLCQLTILDRWSVDESADWFRDAYGRAVRVDRLLPPQMVETVSMDLFCLKSARDRSLGKVADLATRLHASIQR